MTEEGENGGIKEMKRVTDDILVRAPRKIPFGGPCIPLLGGTFFLLVSRLFPKGMFVCLKGKPC